MHDAALSIAMFWVDLWWLRDPGCVVLDCVDLEMV